MRLFRNFDSNETWTLEELEKEYEDFRDEMNMPSLDTFEEYLDWLLFLGREREGGLIEIESVQ